MMRRDVAAAGRVSGVVVPIHVSGAMMLFWVVASPRSWLTCRSANQHEHSMMDASQGHGTQGCTLMHDTTREHSMMSPTTRHDTTPRHEPRSWHETRYNDTTTRLTLPAAATSLRISVNLPYGATIAQCAHVTTLAADVACQHSPRHSDTTTPLRFIWLGFNTHEQQQQQSTSPTLVNEQ